MSFAAGRQRKRNIIGLRSKSDHRLRSSSLVVAQTAPAAAVMIVVVVGLLRRTIPLFVGDVVVESVVVGSGFIAFVFAMVGSKLIIACVGAFVVDIRRRFAVAARLLLAEASVVAFIAQRRTSWYGTPKGDEKIGLPAVVTSVP